MRFLSTLIVLAAALLPVLAGPTPNINLKSVQKVQGTKSGQYIVKFKSASSRKLWAQKIRANRNTPAANVTEFSALDGLASTLDEDLLNELRASDDVEYVTEDGYMYALGTQTNAPWGLRRISQTAKLASGSSATGTAYTYPYDDNAGAGVDVYVIDTGILTTHTDFGGRARFGFKASSSWSNSDGNGHGTHCAGTIGGSRWGVAKKANIIAVKVLSDSGSGTNAQVIAGIDYVLTQAKLTGRPSVASMSLGGSAATAIDDAVKKLIAAGVHVVVAAGNDNTNASSSSPARVPDAITVGATDIADKKSSFSNYGSLVDIFAPGTSITSAWIGSSNSATNTISGTSMATPHVAGIVAYWISKNGNTTPVALATALKNAAVKNALTGLPSGTANNFVQRP